jgi:hypothetical protein
LSDQALRRIAARALGRQRIKIKFTILPVPRSNRDRLFSSTASAATEDYELMSTPGTEIIGTMTIKEAADIWQDPRREHLLQWAEAFGVQLRDLHLGHIRTYQKQRGEQVSGAEIDVEVEALLALLKQIDPGNEIFRYCPSFAETGELTAAELRGLPEPVRRYVGKLEKELSDLRADSEQMKKQIRKANWGRSR